MTALTRLYYQEQFLFIEVSPACKVFFSFSSALAPFFLFPAARNGTVYEIVKAAVHLVNGRPCGARPVGLQKPMSRYPIPAACPEHPYRTELVIRRSRFITHCAHTPGPAAARSFIESIRREHASATHNCWAFVGGAPGHSGQVGFSDDGEPHGTAGRPMLQVLLHCGIGEICMVVTRYFGGVKLGTGGLVRAYQDAVRENLRELPRAERIPSLTVMLSLAYAHLDRVRRLLPDYEAATLGEDYDADARLRLRLPEALWPAFAEAVATRTDGRAVCRILEEEEDFRTTATPDGAGLRENPPEKNRQ